MIPALPIAPNFPSAWRVSRFVRQFPSRDRVRLFLPASIDKFDDRLECPIEPGLHLQVVVVWLFDMGRRAKRVKVGHSSSRLTKVSQPLVASEGAPSYQPFPSDFPTEVWLEVHLRFSFIPFLPPSVVTGVGEGRIMGPFLALLDVESPAGITQTADVHQPLGKCIAAPSQY